MNRHHHGLSVGIEAHGDLIFVVIKAIGKLTHDDYRQFTPMLESALAAVEHPHCTVWAVGRNGQLVRMCSWQEWFAKIGSWFIGGRMEGFTDKQQELLWLSEN